MRDVYPGFLQLNGFVSMNLDRHIEAHKQLFLHLVRGDGDSAQKHKEFYDEYLAVMDLDAEFYLQTVETVFVRHALPKGEMTHRGRPVDPSRIKRTALLTVEGELDDISGVGQTEAAHRLCANIPPDRRVHYLQPGVGHYGVFNGSRFRSEIVPRISDFVLSMREPNRGRAQQCATAPATASRCTASERQSKRAASSRVFLASDVSNVALLPSIFDSEVRIRVRQIRAEYAGRIRIRGVPPCCSVRCFIAARASRKRSRSCSTVRFIRCACGGTGKRAAIRFAFRRRLAKSFSPFRRAAR